MDFYPSIICPTACKARSILQKAWDYDWDTGIINNAVAVSRERDKNARNSGISERETRNWEFIMWFAPCTNSGPVVFWFLSYIYADTRLLEEIRAELKEVVTEVNTPGSVNWMMLTSRIQNQCPLLYAAWEETLRLAAPTVSVRLVTEDCMLGDKYLIKKGAMVLLPSNVNN